LNTHQERLVEMRESTELDRDLSSQPATESNNTEALFVPGTGSRLVRGDTPQLDCE
jgi:hypothetical protein